MTAYTDHAHAEPIPIKLTHTPLVWALFSVWGVVIYGLSANGVFEGDAPKPPINILIAVSGPALLFLSVYSFYTPLRAWVDRLDLTEIIILQAWRVIGFTFLAILILDQLPPIFALPAGLGDVAVGLAAPAVALSVERRTRGWRRNAYMLTAAGLLDFVAAFGTGVLARDGAPLQFDTAPTSDLLGVLPLSLFPAFFVPAFLLLHVITLIKLRRPE